MEEEPPSQQLLKQRIRESIIDYLETASSAEEQRDYERRVPIAQVPAEMINLWEDSVDASGFDWYGPPVFSLEENAAIRAFNLAWEAAAAETPDPMPHTIDELIGAEPWDHFMRTARKALLVFDRRGRFSPDAEEPAENLIRG